MNASANGSQVETSDTAIKRTVYAWGYFFKGDKEALIRAGHAKPDWFEDGSRRHKGRNKGRVIRSKDFEVDGRQVRTVIRQKSRIVDLWLCFTAEEKKEHDTKESEREASNGLSSYASPDEFREGLEDFIVRSSRGVLSPDTTTVKTSNGYRYTLDPAGGASVLNALEAAVQGLRTVPVKIEKLEDPAQKKVVRDQAASASVDSAFQRFIGRAVGEQAGRSAA